jgi:hypothetical protein
MLISEQSGIVMDDQDGDVVLVLRPQLESVRLRTSRHSAVADGPLAMAGHYFHPHGGLASTDGFVKVRSVTNREVQGYIRSQYLVGLRESIESGGCAQKILTDDAWYCNIWMVDSLECSIRVSQASPMEPPPADEQHLSAPLGSATNDVRFAEGYTYVSLEVGFPQFWEGGPARASAGMQVCRPTHPGHFTIAKAAPMDEPKQKLLHSKLSAALSAWLHTAPHQRPFGQNLFYARRLQVCGKSADPRCPASWRWARIVMWPKEEIEEMLRLGLVQDPNYVPAEDAPPDDFTEHILRLWDRDVKRWEAARTRATRLQPHSGFFQFVHQEHGLNIEKSEELFDLLEYLKGIVRFFSPAFFNSELYRGPPACTKKGGWHCTKPSGHMLKFGA